MCVARSQIHLCEFENKVRVYVAYRVILLYWETPLLWALTSFSIRVIYPSVLGHCLLPKSGFLGPSPGEHFFVTLCP